MVMECHEFRTHLDAYVDRELAVNGMLASETHAAECWSCASRAAHDRRFRQLLRQQPRESGPAELRARITAVCRQAEGWRAPCADGRSSPPWAQRRSSWCS
jgi:anti-sigma factor RsiW